MVNKVVVSVVSLVLVVGVVIGGVAVVVHKNGESKDSTSAASPSTPSISTSTKYVDAMCKPTEFKDSCYRSLSQVAKNESATFQDYLVAALNATIEEVRNALGVATNTQVNNNKDPYTAMAVEDCEELLDSAVDLLQAAISDVGDPSMHTINDRITELRNWLTSVYAFQSVCKDQIKKPQYKSAITNGMINATQLTANALVIMEEATTLLKNFFNVSLPVPNVIFGGSRRLLSAQATNKFNVDEINGHEGEGLQMRYPYPYSDWFSNADRKLLSAQTTGQLQPHAIVDQNGSGQFKTIAEAIAASPQKRPPGTKFIIYVKAGIYNEYVTIPKKVDDIFMYGDGPTKTIINGNKSSAMMQITTQRTGTLTVQGKRFIAKSMTIQNTAGPAGHQAVAMVSKSDMSAYFDCVFDGYQDTLYYQAGRHLFSNCTVKGTIDFIFGKGSAVIQNSLIVLKKGSAKQFNTITSDGRDNAACVGGLSLQNCKVVADQVLFPSRMTVDSYLGRPWGQYARTIFLESDLGDFIRPVGYFPWLNQDGKTSAGYENTCQYLEYNNRGPSADTTQRPTWKNYRVITDPSEATAFTPDTFLQTPTWTHLNDSSLGLPPFTTALTTSHAS